MAKSTQVYLVAPPGPGREQVLEHVPCSPENVFDSVDAFVEATRREPDDPDHRPGPLGASPLFPAPRPTPKPNGGDDTAENGVVMIDSELHGDEALRLARALADRAGTWIPVVIDRGGNGRGPVARPLSVGFPLDLGELAVAIDNLAETPILELRSVLKFVSRARHDINNPLTSGLAEAQLLLMDLEEGEVRESLEVIQDQLRRIRDLVHRLSVLRQPPH